YRRLPEARYNAKKHGYEGAMFPWQSGSNGREESQEIHLNPRSGRWIPDNTKLQRHVNAAIAYNIWQYFQVTNDLEFISFFGAEMFLEITRFWASKVQFNPERDRYELHSVVGPDEYHTSYPGGKEPGICNNAYTNIFVIWVMTHAFKMLDVLKEDRKMEMLEKMDIKQHELEQWQDISGKMFIPVHENGLIEQFEGYSDLEELDWEAYHDQYGEILRLDRILEKENDNVNRYKASKQADVLMLFYLFSADELHVLFNHAGYGFDSEKMINKNIEYYEQRTSHGSTLSKLVSSWVLARSDRKKSWQSFRTTLMSDVKDVQGGTTKEGIHLGAMAGTVDLVQRCYSGLEVMEDALRFDPVLPDSLSEYLFRLKYRSYWLNVKLTQDQLIINSEGGWSDQVKVVFDRQFAFLKNGETKVFDLQ
ncbi:MAG: glycosyl hydrolase family 65 protein, partial [Bacteroidota bacterium]